MVDLNDFKCPVCFDFYKHPMRISCGGDHTLCQGCLQGMMTLQHPTCPKCRGGFDPRTVQQAMDVAMVMSSTCMACQYCKQKMPIDVMGEHTPLCPVYQKLPAPTFRPIRETQQQLPSNVPNRATFQCPFCPLKNLDLEGLKGHCNERHAADNQNVVCPVCASMPWGNSTQRSGNFLHHLNMRHKFEYDTFVNFEVDEDAQLQAVLQASLIEK